MFAAAIALPLWETRLNRVSPAESFLFFHSGFLALEYVLLFFPLILALAGKLFPKAPYLYYLLPASTVLSSLFLLYIMEHKLHIELGEYGRLSPSLGWLLYLLAGSLPLLSSRPPRWAKAAAGLATVACLLMLFLPEFSLEHLGIWKEAVQQQRRLGKEIANHMKLTLMTLVFSTAIGIPIAVLAYNSQRKAKIIFPFLNFLQTIPSIALFGLLIAPLSALGRQFPVLRRMGIRGIGNTPALIALTLYALYPVIRYSFSGLKSVDQEVIDAARGMGMTAGQLKRKIILPLSLPVILNGIRVAGVQTLGNVTLAKLIGGSGLGVFVFEGLGQASTDMVLLGMTCIILLTLLLDKSFQILSFRVTPPALRNQYNQEGGLNE